jgi:cysteine synthase B
MNNIVQTIGKTPLVRIEHPTLKKDVHLYVKLEGNNPGGSVKDRAAFNMINEAIKDGLLKPEGTVVEATSGNTGIAIALIAKRFDIHVVLVMPENATPERIKTMKAYGAEVVLTDKKKGIEGSRDVAELLEKEKGYFRLNQFENENNWKAHYKTTGPEVWEDSEKQITHFVSAMGTTGTIMGTSTYLKEKSKQINIVGVHPKDGAKIPGIRKWSEDYVPSIFDPKKVYQVIEVSEEEATIGARNLASKHGVFAGMSSGGAFSAALKLAEQLTEGFIVMIICDRGDRYLSSQLY